MDKTTAIRHVKEYADVVRRRLIENKMKAGRQ